MPGTRTSAGCGESPAVRRSWLPRTVAAVFLGAGVYAALALAGDVVAHADDTSVTATQAPAEPAPAGDASASGDASPAPGPVIQDPAATSPSTADTASAGTTSPDPDATPPVNPTAVTTGPDAAGTATPPGTTSTTTTTTSADGTKTTLSTTVTAKTTEATTAGASTADPSAAGAAPQDTAAPAGTTLAAGPVAAVVQSADDAACHTAPLPEIRAGGSASRNQPLTAYVPVAPATATAAVQPAAEATVAVVTLSEPVSDGAPAQPQSPFELPAPASAFTLSGCGGPGASEGSPKGASTPAAAGVLGSLIDIPVAETDAAPQAPTAGSPTLSANDPAARPD